MLDRELLVPGNVLLYDGRSVAYVDEERNMHWVYRQLLAGENCKVIGCTPIQKEKYKVIFNIKEVPEMWRELHKDD